ncbi:fibronectin-binding protein A N-terminus-domain-containing protein [Parachaetomium inaequale]|uniref:Ribosome quality control complex subunit 2 n=1 Tax=Parachaetomium inaequale TaxID=2588326 RepID=A0AAN6PMB2_9PEZI|nr:fibronectin-binding protein A N-terminus-domain-containing protein [Parachaetomium inaequale]
MKQRFSSLDVKVIAHELAEALVSLRLANIYDLNSKILLLKFAKPDSRQQVLIESGFRCHLTDFARAAAPAPSHFVSRLRKFLKTRRVTGVSQIGTDRIIEFQFSDGAYRLYLEFFASGNVILTDAELKILALLRNVPEGEGQEPQRVGLAYTLENRQNFGGVPPLTKERLRDALKTASTQAATKKTKKKGSDDLRRGLVTTITELPPVLVDHVFRLTNFDPATKPAEILDDEPLLDALFHSLEQARSILDEVTSAPTAKGYIIAKTNPHAPEPVAEGEEAQKNKARNLLYEDFQPFLPKQFEENPSCEVLRFDGYNKTVDEFFSSLEGQKLESRLQEREATAKRKLEAARRDQAQRIEGLQGAQMLNLRKAAAIQANIERVQEAMDAINGLLQQGMDWVDVNKLVEREQKQHNPVAEIIKLPMRLNESMITLLLGEEEEEAEAEDKMDFDYVTDEETADDAVAEKAKGPDKRLVIDINLKLTPWNNAREYYDQKRTAADKQQKTVQQSEIALKNAEQKIAEDLKKGLKQEKPVLQPIRKQMWFEKFIWFISSDGYLVLGGRDAQQNEILYKRYLRKGDVYVHADMHGASTVIIKNNPKTPDAPIPPSTLAQAGNLSVCCSNAWDSKAAMGAWWVNADQVSKSAPAGEYLPVGSFMVRGKRNFLPPALLILGFGLMFRISEESKAKHVKHRLYDAADISTTGAASVSVQTEVEVDAASDREDLGESSDEEGDEDEEKRANPLQSGGADDEEPEPVPEQDSEPPTEELAGLEVSQDSPAPAEPDDETQPNPDEDNSEAEAEEEQESTPSTRPETPSTSSQHQQGQKKQPPKRGQRGKAKKIASKYKHQDDEDRALMEDLLGVSAARQKADAAAAAKAQREADAAAARERRLKAQERAKKQIAEHEEVRQRLMLAAEEGDGDVLLDDEETTKMELGPLDALVGTPLPGDEILEAVPVCAPWGALGRVKYKAKLQPGHVKKGKAVKEIVERWRLAAAAGKKGAVVDEKAEDVEKMWPREVALIKGLKVEEAFNAVPVGKVTVMMSGGTAGGGSGGKGGGKGGGGGGGGGQKGGKGKGGKKR